jgi:Ca-activated chloride channel family protein
VTVFERTTVPERVLIVLTDGNDTGSLVPPAKAAEIARDKNIVVHAVAVGDPKAAGEDKLDEAALKQIAQTTGGTYSHANNLGELEAIYRRLDALPTQLAKTVTHRPRRDLFMWPLAAAMLLSFGLTSVRAFAAPAASRHEERRRAA